MSGAEVAWLAEALAGDPVVSVRPLTGGYRNDNRLLVTASGARYVLRRCLRAGTCAVEAALPRLLHGIVPVAEVVAADVDGEVTGQPLLLSRFVDGELVSAVLDRRAGDRELGLAVGRGLTAVGTVRFGRPGPLDRELVPDGELPTDLAGFVRRCLSTGAGTKALTAGERDRLIGLARERQPLLLRAAGVGRLVHSDFNPKNVMVARRDGNWVVTAVLDWEFAYSGHPLADVGNMLRFADDYDPGYVEGFVAGLGDLPAHWQELAETLHLFALAELMSRGGALWGEVVGKVRRLVEAGT